MKFDIDVIIYIEKHQSMFVIIIFFHVNKNKCDDIFNINN